MEIRNNMARGNSKYRSKLSPWVIVGSIVVVLLLIVGAIFMFDDSNQGSMIVQNSWSSSTANSMHGNSQSSSSRGSGGGSMMKVFYPSSNQQTAAKLQQDLRNCDIADPIVLDTKNPPQDLVSSCPGVPERLEVLTGPSAQQPHLAMEVLKYCALSLHPGSSYIDSESPLMVSLDGLLSRDSNVAILNDPFLQKTIHGSFLKLQDPSVAKDMLQILLTTNLHVLESNPLLLPKSLYDIIATRAGVGKLSAGPNGDTNSWYLWQHSCTVNPLGDRQVTAPISNYALQSYR